MKKTFKKNLLKFSPLLTLSTIVPVAAVLTSCNSKQQETKDPIKQEKSFEEKLKELKNKQTEGARVQYKETYKQYNQKLDDFAKKYKELATKLSSAKTDEEKKAARESIEKLNFEAKFSLRPLLAKSNYLFKQLKELEKDSDIKTIKIFHTNDEHGRLKYDAYKYNNYSGMDRTSQYIRDKNYDLLISAGDMIQGLPLSDSDKGDTITQIAKYTGYDSITVGNHEFDYGLKHVLDLDTKLQKEEFGRTLPFISANIFYKDYKDQTDKPEGYDQAKVGKRVFKPYIIKELENGIKVAIMGITTPDTAYTSHPKNSKLVEFKQPVESAKETIAEIKKDHPEVNFIIASTHLGTGRSQVEWTSEYLAEKVPEIDLILDGHSHTYVQIKKPAENAAPDTYVTQTEAYTKYLGDIEIEFDSKTGKIKEVHQQLRDINQITVATSDNAQLLIKKLEEGFNKENQVVAFSSPGVFKHTESQTIGNTPYWIGRIQPTSLGVMAADSLAWGFVKESPWTTHQSTETSKWEAGTIDNVIGLMNGGGLRTDLKEGEVTKGDILGISPFGNRISAVKLKGSTLLEALKHGLSTKARSGGFAQLSSNVAYHVNVEKGTDPRTNKEGWLWKLDESSIKINDKAIELNKDYYLVTNDYILAGGDDYKMLNTITSKEIELAYEGEEYIKVLTEFAKEYTKADATTDKAFSKKLADYLKPETIAKQSITIPAEAKGKDIPEPDNKA
ncbi:5'-nucleotidase C-terminal domain-containing protein [Mycoplasma procyoni]|uniref:5'-nucleotidase C-terminal domain-containing protein n=1 Tax=Mycoplasma procyoni TaxID=568784 RepID=UPI00197B4D5C|nr:5'-nucleotidase C-terminal domain-containing protein [Mycoplasma procyoni]MBN3534714.1 5'-nucleotidase C-terminal domain-containing protein [Mycoplasma procyoni]